MKKKKAGSQTHSWGMINLKIIMLAQKIIKTSYVASISNNLKTM